MTLEQEIRQIFRDELTDLKKDVKLIRGEMTTLKVKVAAFSAMISSVATLIANKFFNH